MQGAVSHGALDIFNVYYAVSDGWVNFWALRP
jgi:hypothetical protein